MDAQRSRRTRDQARRAWYAYYRQVRFARFLGFLDAQPDYKRAFRGSSLVPRAHASRVGSEALISAD